MCGDGFESARAYGEGAAGGDAAFYPAKVGSLFFFLGRVGCEADDLSRANRRFACGRVGCEADDLSRGGDL